MKAMVLAVLCFSMPHLHAQSWFATGQNADLMLSGVDFNNSGGPLLYNHPSGIASDGTRFLLCDRFNNRVLIWNSPPAQWNTVPDFVLGQSDFTANNPGTSRSELNWPGNVSVGANGVVVVADTENDRILIWHQFPTQNAQQASVTISLPSLSPPGLAWPWGVWTDGTRVAAVATRGATILFWNSLPTIDNQAANYSIRLPQQCTPRNISTDGSTYFFVGDHNSQVAGNQPATYFWNSYPTQNNQPYDFYRSEWIKGVKLPSGKLIAGGLGSVYLWNTMPTSGNQPPDLTVNNGLYKNGDGPDVVFAGGRYYINNYNGNNVHVFNALPSSPTQVPDFAVGSPSVYVNTLDSINYIQNPVLTTDGTRLIATSDFDAAMWIWTSFPQQSGRRPGIKIPLRSYGLAPWDNALFNGRIVLAGKNNVAVWNSVPLLGEGPSRIFSNSIGGTSFQDLRGVALDSQYLYVADAPGSIYVWAGIPVTGNEPVVKVITLPGSPPNHLNSDGTYLCVTVQSGSPSVYIYRVSDIALPGTPQPYKTIASTPTLRLNLPAEALTFNGSLAIANTSNNAVYLWREVLEGGDTSRVVVLGQSSLSGTRAGIGINRLFMPASLLVYQDRLWIGELKFSSRIVQHTMRTVQGIGGSETACGFGLVQNYPNPFNPTTTIQYSLPTTGANEVKGRVGVGSHVMLNVYDVLGREVATLVNEVREPGIHTVQWNASGVASGVYVYRLQTESVTRAKRLVLLK